MLITALLFASLSFEPVSVQGGSSPTRHVVVLHTNDVHGQAQPRKATWIDEDNPPLVGGIGRIAAYANVVRAELAAEQDAGMVFVDGGDWFQGTPEGKIDEGLGFVRAMVHAGYDAMCLGNHEFDYGLPSIDGVLRESNAPGVLANVFEKESGERFKSAPPFRIVERAGFKIALVGLVTPVTPTITHPDAQSLRFDEPSVALTAVRAELPEDVDWVLPVGHLGVEAGRDIARVHSDLPLIVGGHTHTYLRKAEKEGETLIVQAGSKGTVIGRVDLWWTQGADGWQVERSETQLVDLAEEPEPEHRVRAVEALCLALVEKSAAVMDVVVGTLSAPLEPGGGLISSSAGSWFCDALRARFGVIVGLQNKGGTRARIAAGEVRRRDVFQMLPFENSVVLFDLSGKELFECVRRAVEGSAHSGLDVSGLLIEVEQRDTGKPGIAGVTSHLVGLQVGGAPYDPEATYRVATNSFLLRGGDGYLDLDWAENVADTGVLLADVAEAALGGPDPIVPPSDNRYRVRKAEQVR